MMRVVHGLQNSGRVWAPPLLTVAALSILVALAGQTQKSNPGDKSVATNGASGSSRVVLYAAVGAELTQYDVDIDGAALLKRGSVTLPANVQEASPAPSRKYFYVGWSNGGPSNI